MKKILVLSLLSFTVLTASSSNVQFSNVKDPAMKEFLVNLNQQLPTIFEVVSDYFEAKTCKKEFYNEITVRDIQKFAKERHFGTLHDLINIKQAKKKYVELINDYRYMNCGEGELFKVPDLNKLRK